MESQTMDDVFTDEELIDLVSMEYGRAKAHINESPEDDEIVPTLTVAMAKGDDEGDRRPLFVHMFTHFDEDRYDILEAVGFNLAYEGHIALAAILTVEAWMSQYEEDEARRIAQTGKPPVAPRDDPNRVEVVGVYGLVVDKRSRYLHGKIHRQDGRRTVEDIEPVVEGGEAMWQSRLVGAFWQGHSLGFVARMMGWEPSGGEEGEDDQTKGDQDYRSEV